jgi:hypothetical protein
MRLERVGWHDKGHTSKFFNATMRGRRSRGCAAAESDHGDGKEKWFGEPEGAVGESGGGPGAEDSSEEEAEADQAQVAGLGEAFFAGLGSGVWGEGLVDAFGYVAQIAGHEGGVVSEAVDTTEAGDLDGGDTGDDTGERHLR